MSLVCRDETLAELKIKKRNLGENMLTRIGLIFNKFSIKNNTIRNIAVADKRVVQGGFCHGLTNHESRIFKFCFEALHVSREYVCHGSRRIFF